jgi:hypothetical protein
MLSGFWCILCDIMMLLLCGVRVIYRSRKTPWLSIVILAGSSCSEGCAWLKRCMNMRASRVVVKQHRSSMYRV